MQEFYYLLGTNQLLEKKELSSQSMSQHLSNIIGN